jgi:deoxyribonuclease V
MTDSREREGEGATSPPSILAVDVAYFQERASVAGVLFGNWQDAKSAREFVLETETPAQYQPGQFYRRELPCILRLLEEYDLHPEYLLVDGFVFLDGRKEPGLGWHLYQALGRKVAVIGVAKSAFKGIGSEYQVHRGGSAKALYVTAAGVEVEAAQAFILAMHGQHRIPTLLKRVDELSRRLITSVPHSDHP